LSAFDFPFDTASDPVTLTIEAEAALHTALQSRAGRQGVSVADVVRHILRKELAGELPADPAEPALAAVIQSVMRTRGHRTATPRRPGS
jgi:plasmid stability protein